MLTFENPSNAMEGLFKPAVMRILALIDIQLEAATDRIRELNRNPEDAQQESIVFIPYTAIPKSISRHRIY
jgi:hypothetical protein